MRATASHLSLVKPPTVYVDAPPEQGYGRDGDTWYERIGAGSRPVITPPPAAHERWLACTRPDERLRHGAYICDCAACLHSLEMMVRVHRRPGLTIVVKTEADEIVTSARELLAQLQAGYGYEPLLFVVGDRVHSVYVGRGSTNRTASREQFAWQARCAEAGRYLPRPRLEGWLDPAPPALGPTASLTIRLPRELERAARAVANEADLDLEMWIVEALQSTLA